ncbi:hypothetical protein MPHO_42230 [Mycolicibacterium phocaicum]|uniref:Uncharacterized protein n=2 Tax=Mycolicibacterium TaxID=1866885 RepID=A0A7I7ZWM8_9MYCO|nr:hypothetical protein [Mycolicibacterium sp. NCC-Tsukiji]TDK90556.1 hypothetical protein EUA03_09070 [Mycolicibacterium mucogenicum]TLH61132.1 hypothetical protein C1S79_24970 [Mycolicibacterium phocaicum]BBZ57231.1 hypothetical protein MPHO_42230 [Mycolicibacterium phocaicum]GCB01342.1 hypothetical protein NCCNTM_49760 [Mycolicibacterium sp. NCC-Tsukiji]
MARNRASQVFRCGIGAAACVLAGVVTLVKADWYLGLGIAAVGGVILLGGRRIFRPAVSRSGDKVVCRYVPWYEGNAYIVNVLTPLMAIAMVGVGSGPGSPSWLRLGGIFLLALTPILWYFLVRTWRRSFLCITPSMLTVSSAVFGSKPIAIQRDFVQSLGSKVVPNSVRGQSLQVEIAYQAGDLSRDVTNTLLLGASLTVEPIDLVNGLVLWRDGAPDSDTGLMDRVADSLRGG